MVTDSIRPTLSGLSKTQLMEEVEALRIRVEQLESQIDSIESDRCVDKLPGETPDRDDTGCELQRSSRSTFQTERKSTSRQAAEIATDEISSELLLRQVLDLVPHEIFAKDVHGNILLSNRAHASSYEMSPEDIVGRNERDLSPVLAEAEQFLNDDLEIIRTGEPKFIAEETYTDPQGEVHFLQTSKIPFQIAGMKETGVLGVAVDITERKRIEQQLSDSNERFRIIAKLAPVGIATLDAVGRETYVNEEYNRIYGSVPDVCQTPTWMNLVHPEDEQEVRANWEEAQNTKATFSSVHRIECDDEIRWIRVVMAVFNDIGEARRISVTLDITKEILARRHLEEQQATLAHVSRVNMMGEMATGIAHEINQPLSSISSYAFAGQQLIEKDGQRDGSQLFNLFCKVEQQALRAGEIIRRLRSLIGKRESVRKRVHVFEPIQQSLELLEGCIREAQVSVELGQECPDCEVLVDEIQIQQVLVNLIRNALDAMMQSVSHHRRLTIAANATSDTEVEVRVCDSGEGLLTTEDVFKTFYTTKPDGIGMGLPISRSIIESHGGSLTVSRNPDHGATFRFTLPKAT